MTRGQLLDLLHEVDRRTLRCCSNHDCPSCSVRDNIMPELKEFILWLEDEENCYGCPGDHICGWILHYPD